MLDQASFFLMFVALLGIPAAGLVAILFNLELPRLIYGQATPIGLAIEIVSVTALIALVLLLRTCLALPSAPRGFYRAVLDFLAVGHWHAAAKFSLAGLLVLPMVWYLYVDRWMFSMFESLGRRALAMSDVQSALDGAAVAYQHALVGGLPLLFIMHLLCRWKSGNRFLPWLLVPLFFVGTVVATIISVTIVHFSR
jgi:hypothetical protein